MRPQARSVLPDSGRHRTLTVRSVNTRSLTMVRGKSAPPNDPFCRRTLGFDGAVASAWTFHSPSTGTNAVAGPLATMSSKLHAYVRPLSAGLLAPPVVSVVGVLHAIGSPSEHASREAT